LKYPRDLIDTADIHLGAEHLELAEILAGHSHARWVKQQVDEGWSYGPQYDQLARQHPDLVPFKTLPETTQAQRRLPILETLKMLLALSRPAAADQSQHPSLGADQDLALILQGLKASSKLNLASLLDLRRETIRLQARTPEIYQVLGDAILQIGEPLMAYDVLAEGLKYWPADLRLQQLLALSLARSGATVTANTLLQNLVQAGQRDNETLGLLARTHKDLWQQATEPMARDYHLQLAARRYRQAHELTNSIWTGINAATLTLVMGQVDRAKSLAQHVRADCLRKLQGMALADCQDYWLLATLGEAALVLGKWAEAEDYYGYAVAVGQGRFGDLSSSRRNALLLVQHLEGDVDKIQRLFQIPRVVVFCGHMVDRPDRARARFPAQMESRVSQAIANRLRHLDVRLGYASAACGSDILFLEALRELKGELHIVLPYNREEFLRDSVNLIPDANWGNRFEQLMEQATEVIIASSQNHQENDVVYEYSNRLLHGLAKMRAEQLGTSLVPLTVWDGQPGDGVGGTANTVALWQQWTDHVEVIDLAELSQPTPITLSTPKSGADIAPLPPVAIAPFKVSRSLVSREIRALLFADVVHYSQMVDEQYLPFVDHFLGAIASLANQPLYQPLVQNTWGDALYAVFPTVEQAGQFALDLCELVQNIDWATKGLPTELNLRIALHAGPVDRHIDPITGQMNYIGAHVNHAARIEPITPPGKVYASQAFAAIAASEGLKHFTCDYVGQMPWAKEYGTFPTYHVHRRLP
jgi:class 3 adenylate cyclase/tetratricopeptide (TPR) repeat protein